MALASADYFRSELSALKSLAQRLLEMDDQPTAALANLLHQLQGAVYRTWTTCGVVMPDDERRKLDALQGGATAAAQFVATPGEEERKN